MVEDSSTDIVSNRSFTINDNEKIFNNTEQGGQYDEIDISDQIRFPKKLALLQQHEYDEVPRENTSDEMGSQMSTLDNPIRDSKIPNTMSINSLSKFRDSHGVIYENQESGGNLHRVSSCAQLKRPATLDIQRHYWGTLNDGETYSEIMDHRISTPGPRKVSPRPSKVREPVRKKMARSISVPAAPGLKLINNTKNENMVLQLVLPGSNNADNYYNSPLDEIIASDHFKERRPYSGSVALQNQELYSSLREGGSNANGSHINHGFSGDQTEYVRGFNTESMPQTPATDSTVHSLHKTTPPDVRKRVFWHMLTTILSGMYALFIVTLGLAVYVTDVIDGTRPIAENYSLYLVVIALAYILFLIVDVSSYNKKVKQFYNSLEETTQNGIQMTEGENGNYHLNISLPSVAHAKQTLAHHYCLSKDQHAANFYLKIGASVFCFGHLIHSLLLVGYQIMFLTSDTETFEECATLPTLILDIIYPIYSFLLLYFIFKYSNIIITRHSTLAKFGIMHCLASSICFWIWTIFRETIEAIAKKSYDTDETDTDDDTRTMPQISFLADHPVAYALTNFNKRGAHVLTNYLNTTLRRFTEACEQDAGMQRIYKSYSPYLYPFSVEYSILVVGVLYIIWNNISICHGSADDPSKYKCKLVSDNVTSLESNVVIHADFHSANKGLFCGIVVMLISVVGIILFMITMSTQNAVEVAILIHLWNSMMSIILMTITSVLAYRQLTKLDINKNYHNLLDDLLIIICMPAFFLNGIFTFIPAVINGTAMSIAHTILEVIQVLIQTPLMMDGLRRTSNSRNLQKDKPGRELITFLIVCNVASWITTTFEVESHGLLDHRYDFYGKELWTILGHMCLPLMMFYRFHSSVCLVDIWKYAYEPPHEH